MPLENIRHEVGMMLDDVNFRLAEAERQLATGTLRGKVDAAGELVLLRDRKAMGIPVLLISRQINRAQSAETVAIAWLPKPYDAADMVIAVA